MADSFALVSALGGGIEALLAGGSIALCGFTGACKLCCASAIGLGSGGSIPTIRLSYCARDCARSSSRPYYSQPMLSDCCCEAMTKTDIRTDLLKERLQRGGMPERLNPEGQTNGTIDG